MIAPSNIRQAIGQARRALESIQPHLGYIGKIANLIQRQEISSARVEDFEEQVAVEDWKEISRLRVSSLKLPRWARVCRTHGRLTLFRSMSNERPYQWHGAKGEIRNLYKHLASEYNLADVCAFFVDSAGKPLKYNSVRKIPEIDMPSRLSRELERLGYPYISEK